tara:strand:+ start:4245 stop:4493 length:249 start_codon:yes stop_codon:yes gene_type:complete
VLYAIYVKKDRGRSVMAILDEQLEMLPKGSLIKIIQKIKKDYDDFSGKDIVEEIRIHNQIKNAKLTILIANEYQLQARREEQ